jgi:hypothetical protein
VRQKKATPGKGRGATPDQFSYTPTPVSLKAWYAWCAGEPEWYEVHEHTDRQPGTKICVDWATDGALECPRCRPFLKTTTCAYVPLYRELDLKSCLVICHDSVSDLLADLVFGTPVMVGRVSSDASVFVRRTESMAKFASALPDRQGPCNLLPSLLSMWKYPQYEQWLMTRHRAPVAATTTEPIVPPVVAQRLSVPPATSEVERLAIHAHQTDPVFGGSIDDVTKKIKARVEKNGKNGKPPKNGDGHHE